MASPEQRRERIAQRHLYGVLTAEHCRRPWRQTARMMLRGGVDVLQLREKNLSDAEMLRRVRELRELTREHGALLIVNDRCDMALLAEADGVHLGQEDLPVEEARGLVGEEVIVGLSTHNVEQAASAAEQGADYIGVGPAFATATKGYTSGGGAELVEELCAATELPAVAVGGITPEKAGRVVAAGARAVAACGALCGVEDPEAAARAFRRAVEEART